MNPIANLPTGAAALFWGVITFSLLVVIHEGGHFIAARAFRVKVHEFIIGLPGPAIRIRSRRTGIAYGVTMVPLGGYVRIAGMEPGREDELLPRALGALIDAGRIDAAALAGRLGVPEARAFSLLTTLEDYGAAGRVDGSRDELRPLVSREVGETDDAMLARVRAATYRGLPVWKRITVLAMGVIVNIVAALLILTLALTLIGIPTPVPIVASVAAGGAAQSAGVRAGDRIVGIDGRTVAGWQALKATLRSTRPGTPTQLMVRRSGSALTLRVIPAAAPSGGGSVLGIVADTVNKPMALGAAVSESFQMAGAVFVAVGRLLNPATFVSSVKNAVGVVGISYEAASAAADGPLAYAWMVALLSLSLGVMNMLPIPPLDGGKIAVELVELGIGRPLPRSVSLALSAIGTVLLFSLIFYLLYSDVLRFIVAKG